MPPDPEERRWLPKTPVARRLVNATATRSCRPGAEGETFSRVTAGAAGSDAYAVDSTTLPAPVLEVTRPSRHQAANSATSVAITMSSIKRPRSQVFLQSVLVLAIAR
jgi:hypothetical protein